jgi:hypothetical protein
LSLSSPYVSAAFFPTGLPHPFPLHNNGKNKYNYVTTERG